MKTPKICLVSSSGGHFEQLKRLKLLLADRPGFVVTEKTDFRDDADYYLTVTGADDKWMLPHTVKLFWEAARVWHREKPDAVISTGTYIAIPFMVLCKLHRKKFIYIETFACVTSTTRTGRLMYRFADLFIYQWEALKDVYPKGVYGGSIY